MRILTIGDVDSWAIGKLTKAIIKHSEGISREFLQHYVHPKHVEEHLEETLDVIRTFKPDVIHFCYWNTARQLMEAIPEAFAGIPKVITHHNQKDTLACDWKAMGITWHVVHTEKNKKILQNAGYENVKLIRHGLDFSQFPYLDELTGKNVGYSGRIVPWKGFKEIAEAAEDLNLPVSMMGKIDKPDYWHSIRDSARERVDMEFVNCDDHERQDFYHSLMMYVGNSSDGREEGTLPYLEAMACGIPVITTPNGTAADIAKDGENALVIPFDDPEALKAAIKKMSEDPELREKLRRNAWNTVKNLDERVMSYDYTKLYYEAAYPSKPVVSVIVPWTAERKDLVLQIVERLREQTYKPIEILPIEDTEEGYNLGKIRNLAAIDAAGEFLMFLDSRFLPDTDAVEKFVKKLWLDYPDQFAWVFGDKGAQKVSFVENFSMIRRQDFIEGGMCNERMDRYGGMTQELRERFMRQGCKLVYVAEAKASMMMGTHMTGSRRRDIIDSKVNLYKMGLY